MRLAIALVMGAFIFGLRAWAVGDPVAGADPNEMRSLGRFYLSSGDTWSEVEQTVNQAQSRLSVQAGRLRLPSVVGGDVAPVYGRIGMKIRDQVIRENEARQNEGSGRAPDSWVAVGITFTETMCPNLQVSPVRYFMGTSSGEAGKTIWQKEIEGLSFMDIFNTTGGGQSGRKDVNSRMKAEVEAVREGFRSSAVKAPANPAPPSVGDAMTCEIFVNAYFGCPSDKRPDLVVLARTPVAERGAAFLTAMRACGGATREEANGAPTVGDSAGSVNSGTPPRAPVSAPAPAPAPGLGKGTGAVR